MAKAKAKKKANGAARRAKAGAPTLHLLKLCVGVSEIKELADWQARRRKRFRRDYNTHRTRNSPRRAAELVAGGSLYWVIGGLVRVRQRLIGVVPREDEDHVPCCELQLAPKLIETEPQPHRPFQGWRYLAAKDAPPDLKRGGAKGRRTMPPALVAELKQLGLL